MISLKVIATIFLLSSGANAAVTKYVFASDKGAIAFHAVGKPSAIKINGTGEGAKGELTLSEDKKLSGVLTLNLKSLSSGIDLRDKHMKEKYLLVEKYPDTQLTVKDLAITPEVAALGQAAEQDLPFIGKLKLKGVEKDVSGTIHIKKTASSLEVNARFSLKLDDFEIDIPKYLGITVASDVSIEVKANPAVSAEPNAKN